MTITGAVVHLPHKDITVPRNQAITIVFQPRDLFRSTRVAWRQFLTRVTQVLNCRPRLHRLAWSIAAYIVNEVFSPNRDMVIRCSSVPYLT